MQSCFNPIIWKMPKIGSADPHLPLPSLPSPLCVWLPCHPIVINHNMQEHLVPPLPCPAMLCVTLQLQHYTNAYVMNVQVL